MRQYFFGPPLCAHLSCLVVMLDPELLPLLRCPTTKQALRLATESEKRERNLPPEEAVLVSEDGSQIYRALMDLPVLLSANEVAAEG